MSRHRRKIGVDGDVVRSLTHLGHKKGGQFTGDISVSRATQPRLGGFPDSEKPLTTRSSVYDKRNENPSRQSAPC